MAFNKQKYRTRKNKKTGLRLKKNFKKRAGVKMILYLFKMNFLLISEILIFSRLHVLQILLKFFNSPILCIMLHFRSYHIFFINKLRKLCCFVSFNFHVTNIRVPSFFTWTSYVHFNFVLCSISFSLYTHFLSTLTI